MILQEVEKPKKRSSLRKYLGKEFYILKRRFNWLQNHKKFSRIIKKQTLENLVIRHRSFLLRPLKDVEMYLQHNKITNLKLASSTFDGILIQPGETFSLWKLVGRPTKSKGYLDGLVLDNGNIKKGIGGGLCQLGNLIYWMALHSPLTIKERWRHSYDVFPDINRTIPFGCGATLSYNYIDLQLENNTEYTFQLKIWLDNEYLNGEILSNTKINTNFEIFETDHIFKQQWWGGYTRHNKIWKKIIEEKNKTESIEFVTENNAIMMYNPLIPTR